MDVHECCTVGGAFLRPAEKKRDPVEFFCGETSSKFRSGRNQALHNAMREPTGFLHFGAAVPAPGSIFSARYFFG